MNALGARRSLIWLGASGARSLGNPSTLRMRSTPPTYQQYAAGKPRLKGAQAILDHFGFAESEARAIVYAREKQRRFRELIDEGAFEPFPDAMRLVTELRRQNVPLAAASSSKNANDMMAQIPIDAVPAAVQTSDKRKKTTLVDCFAANVCGHDVEKGKPAPDLFLLAAAALAVDPADCVVVEDAPAGVAAAKNGGMKAIGIARLQDEALLSASGADLVVRSLDEIEIDPLLAGTLAPSR
jgi:HAD superfamily hydrolase (TIGR01509 family)